MLELSLAYARYRPYPVFDILFVGKCTLAKVCLVSEPMLPEVKITAKSFTDRIRDIYCIHNATKLLLLTNQTKLTLTVTLTLTDTVAVIFLRAFR